MLQNNYLKLSPFLFAADPDPDFHFDADANPDPASQSDADPQHWLLIFCLTRKNV
jgi:hypothetical protein